MNTRLAKEIEDGRRVMHNIVRNCLENSMKSSMFDILADAVNSYAAEKVHLTGNTINSFGCGLYVDGKCVQILLASDMGLEPATFSFAFVGAGGFSDWDTGEYVNAVKPYKNKNYHFVGVDKGKFGENAARDFLKNYKGAVSKGISLIVVAGVPYAEFLANKRKLDVLRSAYVDASGIISKNLKRTA